MGRGFLSRLRAARWAGPVVTVAGVGVAVALIQRSLPDPGAVVRALAGARWWWLGLAMLLQVGSVAMYALQQRLLLVAFGGVMSHGRALAVTLARTVLSVTMPAGGAVSTAFAVRQYCRHGVKTAAALAITLLVSLQASAVELLLYAGWCATAGLAALHPSDLSPEATIAVTIAMVAGAVSVRRHCGALGSTPLRFGSRWSGALNRWGCAIGRRRLGRVGVDAARAAASLPRRYWLMAGGAAAGRRVLDIACMVAVARAYGIGSGLLALVGAYLAVQVVRQIPLGAGGAGLVEASLLAALVAAGSAEVAAAVVVLVYRLLSCWLIVLAGLPVLPVLSVLDGNRRAVDQRQRAKRYPGSSVFVEDGFYS